MLANYERLYVNSIKLLANTYRLLRKAKKEHENNLKEILEEIELLSEGIKEKLKSKIIKLI